MPPLPFCVYSAPVLLCHVSPENEALVLRHLADRMEEKLTAYPTSIQVIHVVFTGGTAVACISRPLCPQLLLSLHLPRPDMILFALQEDQRLLASGLKVGSDRRNALVFILGEKMVRAVPRPPCSVHTFTMSSARTQYPDRHVMCPHTSVAPSHSLL